MVRTEPTANDSYAAIFERSKFGMAIAAMIRIIATTISNSISENPFCFFMMLDLLKLFLKCQSTLFLSQPGDQWRGRTYFAFPVSCILLIIGTILRFNRALPGALLPQEPCKPGPEMTIFVSIEQHKSAGGRRCLNLAKKKW